MTDDELSRIIHNLGDGFRPDSPYSRRLVLAGYRAGLEEVAKEVAALKKRSYLGRTGDDDCDDLLRWLDAKLKGDGNG